MGWSKHPERGMEGLMAFQRTWDLPKVKQIPTFCYNVVDDRIMILLIDVDDILLKGEHNIISDCKKKLAP